MKRSHIIITSIMVSVPILVCLLLYANKVSHQDDWKKRTTPLPVQTKKLLCTKFDLLPDNARCDDHKDVYALDFVDIMDDIFKPYETYGIKSSESATYDEVEEKIGAFRYDCEPVEQQADGLVFFTCSYDLRGDRKFVITILFTFPEKAAMRIMSTSRFGDD